MHSSATSRFHTNDAQLTLTGKRAKKVDRSNRSGLRAEGWEGAYRVSVDPARAGARGINTSVPCALSLEVLVPFRGPADFRNFSALGLEAS